MAENGEQVTWGTEINVVCVVCPECAFTFDAFHTNEAVTTYQCPACAELKLTAEVDRLHRLLEDAAGKPGPTCTDVDPDMAEVEWCRRQWRNALDQWKFWRDAYAADIGTPAYMQPWQTWRAAALKKQAENHRLIAELSAATAPAAGTPGEEG